MVAINLFDFSKNQDWQVVEQVSKGHLYKDLELDSPLQLNLQSKFCSQKIDETCIYT